ncbi:hypothetical protein ThidrDRAFT_0233 [Thiorhodococcus drewsii AZ1]|uniref:Lipoprotein n=1 Tax=Thiorhodococcus drewsii AZ1 TaxID=765913 RepID=G2DVR3_9GAMM|nr:hypothetical protein [Thiorhodococcus drewsii]EGV34078.1 hypothetical protein ThidrDRAFT_0233 [Thiorhodococcus drewsii AZ1]
MSRTSRGLLSLFITFAISACNQGDEAKPTSSSASALSSSHSLGSETNADIRAIKDAIAEERLGHAEGLLNALERRSGMLSEDQRAELERVSVMLSTEKEIRGIPGAD